MCIILDASCFSDYVRKTPDMDPVRRWLEGTRHTKRMGKLAYSPTPKFKKEVSKHRFERQLKEMRRAGILKEVPVAKVQEAERGLREIKSNDPHVVALAIAGNVSVLVSRDKDLHEDFKTLAGGKVYQRASHSHLLTPDLCD